MAEYDQIMQALRNAHAAGDTAAAQRLAQMAKAAKATAQPLRQAAGTPTAGYNAPERTVGQQIYENVIGSGAVDTPGERAGELVRGVAPALARGAMELVGLPGTLSGLLDVGAQKIGLMPENMPPSPVFSALSGAGLRSGASALTGGETEYVAPGRAGQFISTGGEFMGGGLGGTARNVATAGLSGLASEAAGQAAEAGGLGETGQAVSRVAGAFFAPMAFSTANKTVNSFMNRASEAPSIDTLKAAKSAAYKAVDDAGVTFSGEQTLGLSDKIRNALAETDFVPDVDAQTRAALEVVNRNAGVPLTLGQLDKIRQGLWKRYNAAPNEVGILDMIDEVDTLVNSMEAATPLMAAARLANSRFKKAELIENAFQKAADQTASTGSGGNIVNKYRQAVTSIINNPKQTRFFSNEEIAMMRNFVRGTNAENTLRLMGKISPSGNGLMMALNIGAIAANPAMAVLTAAGAGAKSASGLMAEASAKRMRDALATGVIPQQSAGTVAPGIARTIPGLLAQ